VDSNKEGLTVPNRCSARFGKSRQRPFEFTASAGFSPPRVATCRWMPPGLLHALLHALGEVDGASEPHTSVEVVRHSASRVALTGSNCQRGGEAQRGGPACWPSLAPFAQCLPRSYGLKNLVGVKWRNCGLVGTAVVPSRKTL
jgi:hypothetical protein